MPKTTRILCMLLIGGMMLKAEGQTAGEVPQFYGYPMAGILMSQLDGDQASGYNKFGYNVEIITGYRWQKAGFSALEFQMSACERGSRRAFDPITFVNAFHIRCRQVELQVNGVYTLDVARLGSLNLLGGVRYGLLLSVDETEGTNPGIAEDFRKGAMMLELGATKSVSDGVLMRVTWNYSLNSAVTQDFRNVFYPTGVYHNGVGVAALFRLGK